MSDFIIPPPTIIKIIETTVLTVAKWGEKLEKRILEEKKDSKFSFLLPDDPFHAFYLMKLEEAKSGQKQKQQQPVVKPPPVTPQIRTPQRIILPPAFTYQQPPDIGGLQLDVIHLTAQNVALYGQEFLRTVARQEAASPLFDFLKPGKPYFRFFCSLCDQYKIALDPSVQLKRRLEQEASSLSVVKDNLDAELQHEKEQIEQRKKELEEAKETEGNDNYDWDDFKVVATIDYDDDTPMEPEVSDVPTVPLHLRKKKEITQISPITGQKVKLEEFGDHLRYEMVHPQYQKELETMKERRENQNSAYAKGDDIAANLRMFAKGETEPVPNAVIWDGREESIKKVVAEKAMTMEKEPEKKPAPKKVVIGPTFF